MKVDEERKQFSFFILLTSSLIHFNCVVYSLNITFQVYLRRLDSSHCSLLRDEAKKSIFLLLGNRGEMSCFLVVYLIHIHSTRLPETIIRAQLCRLCFASAEFRAYLWWDVELSASAGKRGS